MKERSWRNDTDVQRALTFSAQLLETSPFEAHRKIISLSSDGEQNVSLSLSHSAGQMIQDLKAERDRLVAAGFIINAIVIENEAVLQTEGLALRDYYQKYVVGGPGHVLVPVSNFQEYGDGLRAKLRRELDHCAY